MQKIKHKIIANNWNCFSGIREIFNYFKVIKKLEKERIANEFHVDLYQEDFDRLQHFINKHLSTDLVLPESLVILKQAQELDIRQIVISDFPIADKLEKLDLTGYFDKTIGCADEIKCWKPHFSILEYVGQIPYPFVVIGDRYDTDGKLFDLFKESFIG